MSGKDFLDAVERLIRQVAAYQVEHFRALPSLGREKVTREYVSDVDLTSESMLYEGLGKLLPEAGFYGEETGHQGESALRWIVDPLDGTTNYLSGLDQFSISVALEQNDQTLLGVVYRPYSQEIYAARRGYGLYHNHQLCTPEHVTSLKNALLGTGFPYRSPDLADAFFPCAQEALYLSRGIRRFGSAALDLSYVAAGFLQGFWESDLQPYDVAAARLFLEEVGCEVTNQRGEPYTPYRDRLIVCAPPGVHAQLLPVVARHYPSNI